MSSAQGEDRSRYQPVIPWNDLSFGFAKATEGTTITDPAFGDNWANMKKQGLVRGAYHFYHPSLPVREQASLFMSAVMSHGLERGDMLAIDAEIAIGADGTLLMDPARIGRSELLQPDSKGRAVIQPGVSYPHRLFRRNLPLKADATLSVSTGARQFLDQVTSEARAHLGGDFIRVLCYSYLSFLPLLPDCTYYGLWVAAYGDRAPELVSPWKSWDFWQFAGGGGQGGADQDAYNGTAASLRSWAHVPGAPA